MAHWKMWYFNDVCFVSLGDVVAYWEMWFLIWDMGWLLGRFCSSMGRCYGSLKRCDGSLGRCNSLFCACCLWCLPGFCGKVIGLESGSGLKDSVIYLQRVMHHCHKTIFSHLTVHRMF